MYILWKDDGQQFHKYNKKNNHLLSQLTENKTVGNPGPGLGHAQKCGGVLKKPSTH
jgi:hypothetical protein